MLARLLERVDRERVVLLVEDDLADWRIERSGLDGRAGGGEDHVDTVPVAPPLAELKAIHGETDQAACADPTASMAASRVGRIVKI